VLTFPGALEKEPYDEHLETGHGNHQCRLHQREIEDSPFRAPDSAEVPVFSCPKVFLLPVDCAQKS